MDLLLLLKKLLQIISTQPRDENESNKILYNDYIINEINSLEDSGRQLISVYTILIGAYLTLLIDNVSILTLRNLFKFSKIKLSDPFDPSFYIMIILLFIPMLIWFYGIYKCSRVLSNDFAAQSKKRELDYVLNNNIIYKKILLKRCYFYMGLGLFIVMIFFSMNIVMPIITSYQDAKYYYDHEDYNESIRCCDAAIAENLWFDWPWFVKGNCYLILCNYTEAIKSYKGCIERNPKSIDALKNIGMAYYKLNRNEDAIMEFNQVIMLENSSEIWFWKGMALESLNRYPEAIDAFNKSLNISPINNTDAFVQKGICLYVQKEYEDAIDTFDKAIMSKNRSDAWFWRGRTLESIQEYDKALLAFNKTIEIDSQYDAVAWYHKSLVLRQLGLITEADDALDISRGLGYNESEI
jgi:tetratricopeptide (TPR) repeat protein